MHDDGAWEQACLWLERLRVAGAANFDPAAFRYLEVILGRAGEMDRSVRGVLVERARPRLEALEQALDNARREASGVLQTASASGLDVEGDVVRMEQQGDIHQALRVAKRLVRALERERKTASFPWLGRMAERARRRGVRLPPRAETPMQGIEPATLEQPLPHSQAIRLSAVLSRALFRKSADDAKALLAVARASDGLPEECGPYNSRVLAARTLRVMADISPSYLRAYVGLLEDLAFLQKLPEPKKPKRRARSKRK